MNICIYACIHISSFSYRYVCIKKPGQKGSGESLQVNFCLDLCIK